MFRRLRVALSTRRLFKNWLGAAIKYLLIKHGLANGLVTVKCNDSTYRLSPSLYSFIVNAYFDGYVTGFRCGDSIELSFSDTFRLIVDDDGAFIVTPDGIRLWADVIDYTVFFETWIYDIHFLGFDLSDWLVLDVGAYIGDTALYYASKGAFVVAVEPVPRHFEEMLRNIELNPSLKPKILPINIAIGPSDGFVDIAVSGEVNGEASIYKRGVRTYRVKSYTLRSLIEHLKALGVDINRFRVRALKMDCKGCEYDVINNEANALRLFNILKIEYSGYLRNYTVDQLTKPLEDLGFKCRAYAHNDVAAKIGLKRHGTIMCVR